MIALCVLWWKPQHYGMLVDLAWMDWNTITTKCLCLCYIIMHIYREREQGDCMYMCWLFCICRIISIILYLKMNTIHNCNMLFTHSVIMYFSSTVHTTTFQWHIIVQTVANLQGKTNKKQEVLVSKEFLISCPNPPDVGPFFTDTTSLGPLQQGALFSWSEEQHESHLYHPGSP